jgi:hypothetical protein
MKTRILFFIAVLMVATVSLQAQIKYGVKGGVNFQNITGKNDVGDKLENSLKFGFHGGAFADIPIAPDFYFEPGLQFSTKGCKYDITTDIKGSTTLSYIEMPLNLIFRPQLGKGYIIVGFGPYVAYGVKGKMKNLDTDDVTDIIFQNKVAEDDPVGTYMRALDAGANIFVGYELPMGLFLTLNSQLGLLNLAPEYEGESSSEESLKNTGFGVSLGFRF